jgi:hypothetical protein
MPDTQTQDTPSPSPAIADLAGPDDKSMAGLVSSLTDLQRKKTATDTKLSNESDEQMNRDRAVRNHAFQLEGVAASEMPKPWDANKEHKKWETNPIDGFGSAGGLFAMVASAFTKAPMENAINGMAGAINSIKEGNEAGYARAYDAFKTNVKLADQRFKTQHELYSDALSLGTADAAASAAKFHNAAVRFGDQQALLLIEHGMSKELFELVEARAKSHEEMIKAADAIDLHTIQKAAVDAIKKNPPQTGDPAQDAMQAAAMIHNVYSGTTEKYGSAENEGVGKIMQQADREKWPLQKRLDALSDWHLQNSAKAPNIQGYQEARQQVIESHPEWSGQIPPDEDAKLLQQFGLTTMHGGGTGGVGGPPKNASQLKIAEMQEIKDEGAKDGKWQTLGDQEKEWKRRQSEPTLPPEDLHRFAQNFADTGDTSIFTNLGRGQQSAGNILAIRNEAYKIIEARGGKPADISMLNARFQGLKAAERAGATQEMKMGSAAYEAGLQANLAVGLSEKLPRTRIVPFNRALQKYEENTSDPDMNSFAAASNTLVNSYVRAISPTGISTDLVRKHAYDMLNTALSDEAYKRVVDVLKQEMRLAVQSPKAFREHMEAEFRHDTDPSTPVPKDILAPTPLENKANSPNRIKLDRDGNEIK